jgi:hypothetical protein
LEALEDEGQCILSLEIGNQIEIEERDQDGSKIEIKNKDWN